MRFFSFIRLFSIIYKEFIQMKRDRVTFVMIVGIPLLQLILFGFAINSNPKNLPTAIVTSDNSTFTRTLIAALQNTEYFNIINNNASESEAERYLSRTIARFIISIPQNFTHDLIRGKQPSILITADATDPMAVANAFGALSTLGNFVYNYNLGEGLRQLIPTKQPFNIIVHAKYNPEEINAYFSVPGLLGVVLTSTMVMITSLAITREYERGTMESLLAMPVKAIEVLIGKIVPYILVGYIQISLIILIGIFLFHIPAEGNIVLLFFATFPFIVANLAVGVTLSTIARNQLQAVQMSFFFFLPSLLLSGFMFPIQGMPQWAQYIGYSLPLSHYLIIVRGIMLKGNDLFDIWPQIWPILIFMVVAISLGAVRYRKTLD